MFVHCSLDTATRMPRSSGNGRRISELFFSKESDDSNIYVCQCGTKRKKTGSGSQNLVSHVQTAHREYEELFQSQGQLTQLQMEKFYTTSKSSNLHGWFDFIINGLFRFFFGCRCLRISNKTSGILSIER